MHKRSVYTNRGKPLKKFSITEFKPTIFFLVKFIGIYVVANLLYGIYVTSFSPAPDPITRIVTINTSFILNACGWDTSFEDSVKDPTTELIFGNKRTLAIYEGCNGINVIIIFVAFLFAFGPIGKTLWWFIPLGIAVIHVMNLLRIVLLFWVSVYLPDMMYFTHKYFFTAILYIVVFLLWIVWVRKFSNPKAVAS